MVVHARACTHTYNTHICAHYVPTYVHGIKVCIYSIGIRQLYPDVNGTHIVLIDDKSDAYIYNPVSYM